MFDDYQPDYVTPSPERVFEWLRDEYAMAHACAHEEAPAEQLSKATTIADWRFYADLQDWRALGRAYNDQFNIDVPSKTWRQVFNPEKRRTIHDLCTFLAPRILVPNVKPACVLGKECVPAGTFLTIRALLQKAGADPAKITPSTPLADYSRRYAIVFWGPIAQLAPRALPEFSWDSRESKICAFGLALGIVLTVAGQTLDDFFGDIASCATIVGVLTFALSCIGFFFQHLSAEPPEVKIGNLRTFRDLAEYVASRLPCDMAAKMA